MLSVWAVGGQSPLESNTSQTDNFDFKPRWSGPCVSIWGWDFVHALYPGMVIRRPPVARSRCPDGILESPVARSRCADGIIMSSYHGDGGQGQNCVGRVPSPPPRRDKPSGPGTCSGRLIHGKDGRDTRTRNASLAGSRGRPGTGSAGRRP